VKVEDVNDQGRIRHIDIYLQMEPLQPEMLKSSEGVEQ
jgi:hypothetical protein